MSYLDSWETIVHGDPCKTVLVLDFTPGLRQGFNFTELASRVGSGHHYLRAKLPDVSLDGGLSSDACVHSWTEEIHRGGYSVSAVLGSHVGSCYALASARQISSWCQRPPVILFDPRSPDLSLLQQEFKGETMSLSSLFSDEEVCRARQAEERNARLTARDTVSAATQMLREFLELIAIPFERAGLGSPGNGMLAGFYSYVSLIAAASQIGHDDSWEGSTVVASSDFAETTGSKIPDEVRKIKFDVRRREFFRSELITSAISDLLQVR